MALEIWKKRLLFFIDDFFFLFGSWGVLLPVIGPPPLIFQTTKKNHYCLDDQVEFVYAAKANAMCGRENVLVDIFWNIQNQIWKSNFDFWDPWYAEFKASQMKQSHV